MLCRLVLAVLLAAAALVVLPAAARAKTATQVGEPQRLSVPGAPDAFYYRPNGKGMKPVLMYLHGRGGNPAEDCRKWARVATQFGWVVCPSGAEDRGGGGRGWRNDAVGGKQIIDATLAALRAKYKRRVQLRGNLLIGFSEGAFVAMQVGLRDARTWNRWLILAANDQYWWGDTGQLLDEDRKRLKGVYLITGEADEVAPNTKRVEATLKSHAIPHKMRIVPGMGHEVPGDRMVSTYRRPLAWLMSRK
jgi:predicted esterase